MKHGVAVGLVGRNWSVRRLHTTCRDFLFHHPYNNSHQSPFHPLTYCADSELVFASRYLSPLSRLPLDLRRVTSSLLPLMSQSPAERVIEEDDKTEAPLTMAASVVLTHLPRDASKALETAGNLSIEKSKHRACLLPGTSSCSMLTLLQSQCVCSLSAQHLT